MEEEWIVMSSHHFQCPCLHLESVLPESCLHISANIKKYLLCDLLCEFSGIRITLMLDPNALKISKPLH